MWQEHGVSWKQYLFMIEWWTLCWLKILSRVGLAWQLGYAKFAGGPSGIGQLAAIMMTKAVVQPNVYCDALIESWGVSCLPCNTGMSVDSDGNKGNGELRPFLLHKCTRHDAIRMMMSSYNVDAFDLASPNHCIKRFWRWEREPFCANGWVKVSASTKRWLLVEEVILWSEKTSPKVDGLLPRDTWFSAFDSFCDAHAQPGQILEIALQSTKTLTVRNQHAQRWSQWPWYTTGIFAGNSCISYGRRQPWGRKSNEFRFLLAVV